jgi:hypothetical protein
MLVRQGDRAILEVRAKAEPADSVMTSDYYTQLPQIRLSPNPTSRETHPDIPTDVTLDDIDVAKLVECAIRHPVLNMRMAVMTAIWNHPDTFRQIFQFGLTAPPGFPDIGQLVAEELAKRARTPEALAAQRAEPAVQPLLPRMPLPAHLRGREKR